MSETWEHVGTPLHEATAVRRDSGSDAGYVYLVEFSNGWLKIGESCDARRRIVDEHLADAAKFGIFITRSWVSPLHCGRRVNEDKLIAYCERHGERAAGRERFTGIAFADVQARAQSLDYPAMATAARAKAQRPVRVEDIDFDRVKALQADDVLWTITQVADALGLSLRRTRQLLRQTTDWFRYGQGQWPPRPHIYSPHPQPVEVTWMPPHRAMLPLPEDASTDTPRWRAGTIRTWAMQTGRMNVDGVPNRAKPPGRPRRSRFTDR